MIHILTVFSLTMNLALADAGFGGGSDVAGPKPAPATTSTQPKPTQQQSTPQQTTSQQPIEQEEVFPQCGRQRSISDIPTVTRMIKKILKIEQPFRRRLNGPTGSWGGENSFTLHNNGGELYVGAVKDGTPYMLAGYMCDDGDGIRVTLVHPMQTNYIKVRALSSSRLAIYPIENGREILQQGAAFAFDQTRGVQ